jgi:hypothetical protein
MARNKRALETGASDFPYETQKGTPVWKIIDGAINDLVENKDIIEATRRDYIVGYICEKLKQILPPPRV